MREPLNDPIRLQHITEAFQSGEWCYANGERTLVRIGFAPRQVWSFDMHELLDDLVWLLVSGRYSRKEAMTVLEALQAQEGGVR